MTLVDHRVIYLDSLPELLAATQAIKSIADGLAAGSDFLRKQIRGNRVEMQVGYLEGERPEWADTKGLDAALFRWIVAWQKTLFSWQAIHPTQQLGLTRPDNIVFDSGT